MISSKRFGTSTVTAGGEVLLLVTIKTGGTTTILLLLYWKYKFNFIKFCTALSQYFSEMKLSISQFCL